MSFSCWMMLPNSGLLKWNWQKKKKITNFLCTDILMGKAFVHAYEYTKYKWKHAFTMENTTFQTSLPTSLNALKHIFI